MESKIKYLIKSRAGETLFEVVLSIGMFGLTVLMVATMFAAANQVSEKSYGTEKALDKAVTEIITEANITAGNQTACNIRFRVKREHSEEIVEKTIERVQWENLYKFK